LFYRSQQSQKKEIKIKICRCFTLVTLFLLFWRNKLEKITNYVLIKNNNRFRNKGRIRRKWINVEKNSVHLLLRWCFIPTILQTQNNKKLICCLVQHLNQMIGRTDRIPVNCKTRSEWTKNLNNFASQYTLRNNFYLSTWAIQNVIPKYLFWSG